MGGIDLSKKIDLTGHRFGKLIVLEMVYNDKNKGYSHCKCLCDCGNVVIKNTNFLKRAKQIPSCGCNNYDYMIKRFAKNIDGNKFGRLTVLESLWNKDRKPQVKCKCDCGNVVVLDRNSVITGHTQSCGCLQKEAMRKLREKDDTGYISDFGVTILQPYQRNDKGQMVWECECGYCGKHFYELPARIKNNHVRSCGCLISSSMESYIKKFLDENNVDYETQYTYDDCLNDKGNKLRFDFAIKKNSEVFYLIEYDGEQHFRSVEYFGGNKGFEARQKYDNIKNDYCRTHNIPLLRLPYYLSNDEIKNEIINILNP